MAGFKWRRFFYGPSRLADRAAGRSPTGVDHRRAVRMSCCTSRHLLRRHGAVRRVAGPAGAGSRSSSRCSPGSRSALPLMAYTATHRGGQGPVRAGQRFIFMPMFLFSGTFFPLGALPIWLQWIGWISPLWHGTELGRVSPTATAEPLWLTVVPRRLPGRARGRRLDPRPGAQFARRLDK